MTHPKDGPDLIDVMLILASPLLVALHTVVLTIGVLVLGIFGRDEND